MKNTANRYLNLTGAPYSPNKPNSAITITNYFTAVATSLAIFGAAYVNPSVEKNRLIYLAEGILGSAVGLWCVATRRREEAQTISSCSEILVIDTQPDQCTPPTSAEILTRVGGLKEGYKRGSIFNPSSLAGAGLYSLWGIEDAMKIMQQPSPHIWATVMPLITINAMDVLSRYRQFNKIAKHEWVITDQGNAIHNFQRDEVGKLANANGIVMAPSGLK